MHCIANYISTLPVGSTFHTSDVMSNCADINHRSAFAVLHSLRIVGKIELVGIMQWQRVV